MRKVYSHLSAEERVRIDELRNRDGLGVRQIVLRIGRDKSTVSREPGRGLWFASNENESYPETAEGGRVDVEAVLLGHDRAAQGRATRASIAQADAHGVFAAARVGHGHAWEGLDARDDRGQAEGRMAVRPAYARQPRMPLPVDPRETAEGIGPQAVPAAGQTASHASEGTPVENARIVKVPAMRPKPTRFGVRLKRLRAKRRR